MVSVILSLISMLIIFLTLILQFDNDPGSAQTPQEVRTRTDNGGVGANTYTRQSIGAGYLRHSIGSSV